MRITFLSWRDTGHPDGGGSEVYVETIAAGLAQQGHEIQIRCAAYPDAPGSESRDGYRVVRRGHRLTVYPLALLWLLGREGRSQDVVVDVVNGLAFFSPLVRRKGVVALVHHVHREQWHIIYPGLAGRLGWFVEGTVTRRLYRRVPHVTVSEASRTDLVRLRNPPNRISVVRNGTSPTPDGRLPRSATPRLVVLSRLVPHKQIEDAIDVASDLRAGGIRVELDLIGDGWWADQIDDHIRARGASSFIHRHGHVDEQSKADLLGRAWLMLLPSVKEGWGQAVMEAACQGTPALAYRSAGGVTESIDDPDSGWLVNDLAEMSQLVGLLMSNRNELAARGARARARSATFDWAASTEAFEGVCRRAAQLP